MKFEQYVKAAKLDVSVGLRLDMPVRWNSTYLMFESAIMYRAAFDNLHVFYSNYKHSISDEDWERCEKICELLEPFYTITKLFSGIHYPTFDLYFMNVWTIHCRILDNKFGSDPLLSDMATMMLEKFEKYWDDYSMVLSFGVVFYPRAEV